MYDGELHQHAIFEVHGQRALSLIAKAWSSELEHTRSIMRMPRRPERFLGDSTTDTSRADTKALEKKYVEKKHTLKPKLIDEAMRAMGLRQGRELCPPAKTEAGTSLFMKPGTGLATKWLQD